MNEPSKPNWRHFDSCGSTNDEARAWALDDCAPAPDFACVTAGVQTAGRGRHGRTWDADPGANVILSIVVRPSHGLDRVWELGFVASLAVAEAIEEIGGRPRLKWPNDVLLDGRKVAGILVETTPPPAVVAIAGIGVNANQRDFPGEEAYIYPPVSLAEILGKQMDCDALAVSIAERLRHWETARRTDGVGPVLAAWRVRIAAGAPVRSGNAEGRLQDVLDDGRALVALDGGTLVRWASVSNA
jgi:BirA family biotin operon repressor/biotin-[acetyl-CoA-carboxylase] ligase